MPTLIVTAGAANANAFVSTAEADAIMDTTLNADIWITALQVNKERAILQATRTFENCCRWKGIATSSGQALSWPRRGIFMELSATNGGLFNHLGVELAYDAIPDFLKRATTELAQAFLTSDRIAEQDSGVISSIAIPGLAIGLASGGSSSAKRTLIPPQVYQIIAFYAESVMGHTSRRVVRT